MKLNFKVSSFLFIKIINIKTNSMYLINLFLVVYLQLCEIFKKKKNIKIIISDLFKYK